MPAELRRLLANELEALIQLGKNCVGDKNPCLHGFSYIWILGELADLLKDLCRPLGALPHVAKHLHEQFLRIIEWHDVSPLVCNLRKENFRWSDLVQEI